ncbi:MAG: c-type cytochrome [Chloroflexi bacterium]|nr:c-type cytochrome [Chloroflexota bacterium]
MNIGNRRMIRSRGMALLGFASLGGVLLAGCARGSYAVDVFPEQHYQQSYKIQEPPRMDKPADSVPITGAPVPFDPLNAKALVNPLPQNADVIGRGKEVFRVNCAMCHGPQAQGDGTVGNFLVEGGYIRPPNLTAAATKNKTDGEIFNIVTNGIVVMPIFKNLLSESDRWAVIEYLRTLQAASK